MENVDGMHASTGREDEIKDDRMNGRMDRWTNAACKLFDTVDWHWRRRLSIRVILFFSWHQSLSSVVAVAVVVIIYLIIVVSVVLVIVRCKWMRDNLVWIYFHRCVYSHNQIQR